MHFIDAILNAQRYRDEILLRPIMSFIHNHHLMLQHDNAQPHVARICTQFLETENILVLEVPTNTNTRQICEQYLREIGLLCTQTKS